jgi:uncharacterized protein
MLAEDELLRDLARPEAYPDPRPLRVELVSTHISWVFLTDDGAWKVKRPVNFGFVDYGTADRRQHFCEEEVRLNRRLAPDVYLGVVPLRRGRNGHSFTGDGEVVDHAVRMRRLPDATSARALLERDALAPPQLAALAERLSRFYACVHQVRDDGRAAREIGAIVEDNLTGLRPFAGHVLDPTRLEQVAAAQRRDLARLEVRLREREEAGRIRDGHGDLRLEHVYFPALPSGEPVVVDAVEFGERYRLGDVAGDVGFFAMELEAAGRAELAEYFLYRFARESNDYDLYPVIDFFLCYRALVRVKVACLLAGDPGTSPLKARRKEEEAVHLLGLAAAHAGGRRAPPRLIAVGGLVGTGKSTLADALAGRLGAPVVSSDMVRKFLGHMPPRQRGSEALYTPEQTVATYEEVLRRADAVLASGRSVILDATFSRREWRGRARALAVTRDARFAFVQATCDEPTLRARLQARAKGPSESDADLDVLERTRAAFEPPDEIPFQALFTADTARDAREVATELQREIEVRVVASRSPESGASTIES